MSSRRGTRHFEVWSPFWEMVTFHDIFTVIGQHDGSGYLCYGSGHCSCDSEQCTREIHVCYTQRPEPLVEKWISYFVESIGGRFSRLPTNPDSAVYRISTDGNKRKWAIPRTSHLLSLFVLASRDVPYSMPIKMCTMCVDTSFATPGQKRELTTLVGSVSLVADGNTPLEVHGLSSRGRITV